MSISSTTGSAPYSSGRKKSLLPYWLISPSVIITLLIVFYPMLQAVWTSFYDFVLFKPKATAFVGLNNYIALMQDPVFGLHFGILAYGLA